MPSTIPGPKHVEGMRQSMSDPCWIGCFYEAVLGPDADKPLKADGRGTGSVAGTPVGSLVAMWEKAFETKKLVDANHWNYESEKESRNVTHCQKVYIAICIIRVR